LESRNSQGWDDTTRDLGGFVWDIVSDGTMSVGRKEEEVFEGSVADEIA
jgi:hypothetical protein